MKDEHDQNSVFFQEVAISHVISLVSEASHHHQLRRLVHIRDLKIDGRPSVSSTRENIKPPQGTNVISLGICWMAFPARSGSQPGMRVSKSLSIRDASPVTCLPIF